MLYLLYVFIFIFGLIIGSFLNAVIYRLEVNRSAFYGRSFCPKCKHILAWYDLAPLFSFMWLKGRCRYCRQSISIQYPLVELATGILFLSIFFSPGGQFLIFNQFSIIQLLNFFYWLYIVSILIIIFIYDLKHYIIPDKIVLPAIIVAFIRSLIIGNYLEIGNWKLEIGSVNSLFAALGATSFFLSIILISKGRWMGFGDVKLAFLMGLILGFPNIIMALFTAFTLGAIIGAGLMIFGDKNLKSQIPFGPFLVSGMILALFFGDYVIDLYLKYIYLI